MGKIGDEGWERWEMKDEKSRMRRSTQSMSGIQSKALVSHCDEVLSTKRNRVVEFTLNQGSGPIAWRQFNNLGFLFQDDSSLYC